MISFIVEYFRKTESYSAERFIAEMFLLKLAGQVVLYLILGFAAYFNIDLVGHYNWGENYLIDNYHWFFAMITLCLFFPLLETIFLQCIPVLLISRWTSSKLVPVVCSAALFAVLHSYPTAVLFVIFFSGLIYAWSFTVFYRDGCISGVVITTIIHGMGNFLAYILFIMR